MNEPKSICGKCEYSSKGFKCGETTWICCTNKEYHKRAKDPFDLVFKWFDSACDLFKLKI